MKQFILTILILGGALSNAQSDAQMPWYAPGRVGGMGIGYAVNPGDYGGASTPASAEGHAIGDMIRSQGMYNQMTTAAMINVEQARSKYIDNQRQWTEVYLMKQRALAAEHAAAKEAIRARNAQYLEDQASHPSHLPPRLDSRQLNPSTGKILWPPALMRDAFVTQREDMEALLASRAQKGYTSELSTAIVRKVREMQDELRRHIREIVTQEYLDARKFLDSLSLEGRYPVG